MQDRKVSVKLANPIIPKEKSEKKVCVDTFLIYHVLYLTTFLPHLSPNLRPRKAPRRLPNKPLRKLLKKRLNQKWLLTPAMKASRLKNQRIRASRRAIAPALNVSVAPMTFRLPTQSLSAIFLPGLQRKTWPSSSKTSTLSGLIFHSSAFIKRIAPSFSSLVLPSLKTRKSNKRQLLSLMARSSAIAPSTCRLFWEKRRRRNLMFLAKRRNQK